MSSPSPGITALELPKLDERVSETEDDVSVCYRINLPEYQPEDIRIKTVHEPGTPLDEFNFRTHSTTGVTIVAENDLNLSTAASGAGDTATTTQTLTFELKLPPQAKKATAIRAFWRSDKHQVVIIIQKQEGEQGAVAYRGLMQTTKSATTEQSITSPPSMSGTVKKKSQEDEKEDVEDESDPFNHSRRKNDINKAAFNGSTSTNNIQTEDESNELLNDNVGTETSETYATKTLICNSQLSFSSNEKPSFRTTDNKTDCRQFSPAPLASFPSPTKSLPEPKQRSRIVTAGKSSKQASTTTATSTDHHHEYRHALDRRRQPNTTNNDRNNPTIISRSSYDGYQSGKIKAENGSSTSPYQHSSSSKITTENGSSSSSPYQHSSSSKIATENGSSSSPPYQHNSSSKITAKNAPLSSSYASDSRGNYNQSRSISTLSTLLSPNHHSNPPVLHALDRLQQQRRRRRAHSSQQSYYSGSSG